ncbi:hypothetical protein ACKKBG_A20245 [Auxenochlorella protothecoides x Auxenochlorella symbiontica]
MTGQPLSRHTSISVQNSLRQRSGRGCSPYSARWATWPLHVRLRLRISIRHLQKNWSRWDLKFNNGAPHSVRQALPSTDVSERDPDDLAVRLGISPRFVELILELPGTKSAEDIATRLAAFGALQQALTAGTLPEPGELQWPREPLCSSFLETASRLQLPRFTYQYPEVLLTLLKHFLAMVHEFEEQLPPTEDDQPQQSEGSDPDAKPEPEDWWNTKPESGAAELADSLMDAFEKEWEPAMENLEAAQQAFEDLEPLMDSEEGFTPEGAVWQKSGWREVAELSRRLARLRPLQRLIAELGRGGGMGAMRRAPAQIYAPRSPLGVVESEASPSQTKGLTRSGELSRTLPSELHLLARGGALGRGGKDGMAASTPVGRDDTGMAGPGVDSGAANSSAGTPPRPGSTDPARLLFMARRLERTLLSYERCGWADDLPTRVLTRQELRPAAEQGPILLCLDTSGSMQGEPESVAKALALEATRAALRQRRRCLLYAFSGLQDVKELELGLNTAGVTQLLDFLAHSFNGGTELDEPLRRCMARVTLEEWKLADILIVTDGQLAAPAPLICEQLAHAREHLGLRTHGLVIGDRVSEAMTAFCSQTHLFRGGVLTSSPMR